MAATKVDEQGYKLIAKWNGKKYDLDVHKEYTVGQVRKMLQMLTCVQPKRQKIIGLGKKSNLEDDVTLESLQLKNPHSFMMVGCADEDVMLDQSQIDAMPLVVNDLDWNYDPSEYEEMIADVENRQKLQDTIKNVDISVINQPRRDKKLLVLDLDHTLLHFKNKRTYKRPFCFEFLKAVYPFYDIVVWSQTSWKWLEIKLIELDIFTSTDFFISFVLDHSAMFTVRSKRRKGKDGKLWEHQVKALEIIWQKFPEYYSARNTVHVDDLSRNFALNPNQGLKISKFEKTSADPNVEDTELQVLQSADI
ncbi:hypothetical protein GUITHDRAFT_107254 [Guillardia theta CCMP2712]|uniref:FCP1 homology domain-containing protein n=1 Tax=Guillardia theta (strain CCMP2712) TaxID=905079 RepID=L1JFI1_GUITC|nr:hypothetical protein GUITHDRAFT_107254 [Guillardia theta CCMP2712]EKX46899.1 hypothetical protein GUITHDRAFT_107254 [Guillardia theta CCMP2712]|eukprot:XP_005833879.1 hypothetical protein GUITHDRAFT_107254 [Guillardia theta CCMP2712]